MERSLQYFVSALGSLATAGYLLRWDSGGFGRNSRTWQRWMRVGGRLQLAQRAAHRRGRCRESAIRRRAPDLYDQCVRRL